MLYKYKLTMTTKKPYPIKRFAFYMITVSAVVVLSSCGMLNRHTANVFNTSVKNAPFDVVIVPGMPYDTAKMNPLFKARMLWAKELYDKGLARNIIFSGSAVHSPYVEGTIMKMLADRMGIPAGHTFIEDKALHTNENISYGIKMAQDLGFTNIAVATDPIQALLVKKHTKNDQSSVHILPFNMRAMAVYYNITLPQIPAEYAFVENFVPLKERSSDTAPIRD